MYKDKEREREVKAEWYKNNRSRVLKKQRATNKRLRQAKQEFVRDIKSNSNCADCGKRYHYCVMDFDHITDDKSANISKMVGAGASWEAIKEEISKCEVVCANCHRIRTFERLGFVLE